jgi:hypothetical protein
LAKYPEADSTEKGKLYKFSIIIRERYDTQTKKIISPVGEMLFEIRRSPVANPQEIYDFIERAKKKHPEL